MVTIQSDRLRLREFRLEDAANLVELNSDPAVQEFLGEDPPTTELMESWIRVTLRNYPSGGNRGFWVAEHEGQFIGWFHLRPSRETGENELGYRLMKRAWGRGLATEGSRTLLSQASGERVIARTLAINIRSRRVMEKLGMELVRTLSYESSGPENAVEYAIQVP